MNWRIGETFISRAKYLAQGKKRKTVVMAAAGRLWLAELERGKYLTKKSAALPQISEESLGKAFSELTHVGAKEITVLYTLPDLRVACRNFPDMTEDELEETMYWEQDRIFGTDTDMRLAWKVLDRDFKGWTVSLAGIKEESFALWKAAAEKGGKKIDRLIPVTALDMACEQPPLYLYGRGKTALLLFREEHRQVSRVLQKETADEKLDIFLRALNKSYDLRGREIVFIPMSQREEIPFWKHIAERWQDKLKEFSFEYEEKAFSDDKNFDIDAFYENSEWQGEETERFSSIENEEISFDETGKFGTEENRENADDRSEHLSFEEKEISEETLWTMILPVMESADSSAMEFRDKEKEEALFFREMNWLRLGQGLSAFFAAAGIFCLLFLGYTFMEENGAEKKLANLSSVQAEMETERKTREKERRLLEKLKSLEAADFRWEQKLVFLGEHTPQGIVLSELEGEDGIVRLRGTADSSGSVARFRKDLERGWGGKVFIEEQKQEPMLKMAIFTLRWEGGRQ